MIERLNWTELWIKACETASDKVKVLFVSGKIASDKVKVLSVSGKIKFLLFLGKEIKNDLKFSVISCELKDGVTYETVSSNRKRAKWRQKQNGFHQVSLLYLSFLTKVSCAVSMGTDFRRRNQWVKNKSENNNNKLDLPRLLTCLEHDSVLPMEVREEMKGPTKREICLAQC